MKKHYLFLPLFLFGLVVGGFSVNKKTHSVLAESPDEIVLNNDYDWTNEKLGFTPVENWKNSGKGYAFNFKLNGNLHKCVAKLFSGSTQISTQFYMWQYDNNSSPKKLGCYGGSKGSLIELGNDWYRYELMFNDADVNGSNGELTFNKIGIVNWSNDDTKVNITLKNFEIIDHYSAMRGQVSSNTTISYQSGSFIQLKNWANSNKGFGFTFKPFAGGQVHAELKGDAEGSKINTKLANGYYLYRNTNVADFGTIIVLDDGWYRYEVMASELTPVSGTENYNLNGILFDWYNAGYGCEYVKDWEIIDAKSVKITYNVDGNTEETYKFVKDPTTYVPKKDGHHFTGWYLDERFEQKADLASTFLVDTTLYAKFEMHDFTEKYGKNETQHWGLCSCGLGSEEKVNHTFNLEVEDEEFLVSSGDCKTAAVYYKSCVCGAHGSDTFASKTIDNDAHIYGDTQIRVDNLSCETDGSYVIYEVCSICGHVHDIDSESMSKTGHDYIVSSLDLNNDKTSAVLHLVCANDENHKQNVNATVTKVVAEATYEKDGLVTYTLIANYEGKQYSKVITESIPKKIKENDKPNEPSGCSSSIVTTSLLISILSIAGIGCLFLKKKDI